MKICRLTSGGKITIPLELRKKYNLTPGRRVKFEVTDDGIRIIPLATQQKKFTLLDEKS